METALNSLRATPEGLVQLGREMRMLAEHCARYPHDVERFWDLFKANLPAGTADDFHESIEKFLDLLDGRLRVAALLRDLAEEVAIRQGKPAVDEGVFANTIGELESIKNRIADLWSWMNAPRPSLDRRMVEESRASRGRGESEDAREILDRLQRGGSITGD
jgi:hypothetical protein